jgi:hypothetical protein
VDTTTEDLRQLSITMYYLIEFAANFHLDALQMILNPIAKLFLVYIQLKA